MTCFGDLEIHSISMACRTKSDHTSDSEKVWSFNYYKQEDRLPFSPRASSLPPLKNAEHEELLPQNERKTSQNHFNLVFTLESSMVNPPTHILIYSPCSISKITIFCFKYLLGCEGPHMPRRAMYQAKFQTSDKPPAIFY